MLPPGTRQRRVKELTHVKVPGMELQVPSGTKALIIANNNLFSSRRAELLDLYQSKQLVPDIEQIKKYFAMTDDLARAAVDKAGWRKTLDSAVEKASTLSNWSEQYTRFISADVGRQMFEALGHTGEELWTNVRIFVNRTQGNYLASQRPVAFQGPVGQAISLFQTYQFNLMQQLFRYAENGEAKSIATLLSMQGSLFGMQGLPGFHALNTHIVGNAANNPEHSDLYGITNSYAGKEVGDWLMYGSMSNITRTALYSRGDINPRQVSVLPLNPMDWPAISGAQRFLSNIVATTSKAVNGADLQNTILFGLEHNGLSRPLSGTAQAFQGYSTTSKASLVSAVDWSNMANASRFLGSRPIDETLTMDALYRKTLYDAVDNDRQTALGSAVKTSLQSGKAPTEEEVLGFQRSYAKAGGRPERFGATLTHWMRDATTPVANTLASHLNNPKAANIYKLMGGQPLPALGGYSTSAAETSVPGVQ